MDLVASRAKASKRTLYAHFENKENLYLAVVEMVRGLVLDRLGFPKDYSDKPEDALVFYCGRYLEVVTFEPAVQMCRVSISEAARFPQGASRHFEALFTEAHSRLAAYIGEEFQLSEEASRRGAENLIGRTLYPSLIRALFGIDELAKEYDKEAEAPQGDLSKIRGFVRDFLASTASG